MISWISTQRGSRRGEFKDRYGAPCWIQESNLSLAIEDFLWLGKKNSIGSPTYIYLTREMAGELAHVLLKFSYTGKLSDQTIGIKSTAAADDPDPTGTER